MSDKQLNNVEWLEQYISSVVGVLENAVADGPTLRRIDEVIGAGNELLAHLKGDKTSK